MKRSSLQAALGLCVASVFAADVTAARASGTFCAVVKETSDGFVQLREGPGVQYKGLMKLIATDFLYVGTEPCRDDFGPMLCSHDQKWSFVESIVGSKLKGWVRSTLLRPVTCPGQ